VTIDYEKKNAKISKYRHAVCCSKSEQRITHQPKQESNGSLLAPVLEGVGVRWRMRHIPVRRCPHTNDFDNIRITISDRTNPPDRVGTFALLYLSPHVSPLVLKEGRSDALLQPLQIR
jgi:hypothetical protein